MYQAVESSQDLRKGYERLRDGILRYISEVHDCHNVSGFDVHGVTSGNNYHALMKMLGLVIYVLIKSTANEDLKQELIEKIMHMDESTQEVL